MGHQIDATGPEIGVCFHRPQSERDIEKIKPMRGQSSGWSGMVGKMEVEFFPIVRVGV